MIRVQSGAVVISQPLCRLPNHPYSNTLGEQFLLIERHTFGHHVITPFGNLARQRLVCNQLIGLRFFTLKKLLSFFVMTNHVIGGFNVGPAEKFVAVFLVVFAFAFAIAYAPTINTTALRCIIARTLETGDVPGLK